ncbi:hypothetical protein [Vibrio phage LP.2]|nr:hypothetical protein [Vibrio phage LP.2]
MNYTPEQTQEAIRQNPQVANSMKLSVNEMRAYTECTMFDSSHVAQVMRITKHAAAMLLKSLERKGYLVKLDKNKAVYGRVVYQ